MPRPEWPTLTLEDTREQLVVLKPECLNGRHQRFETKGQCVPYDEQDHGTYDRDDASGQPQARRALPDDQAKCGMSQAECGESGEGNGVGAKPHNALEELDGGLCQTRATPARLGEESGKGKRQPN